jgi:hypothetical protein
MPADNGGWRAAREAYPHGSVNGEVDDPFLHCAYCAGRIGVYEQLWMQLPDGMLKASSFPNLTEEQRRNGKFFHVGCPAPALPQE